MHWKLYASMEHFVDSGWLQSEFQNAIHGVAMVMILFLTVVLAPYARILSIHPLLNPHK
jgi:hypothetical protein